MDKHSIQKLIIDLTALETLSRAYAEIASGRMKKTREGVLTTRDFLSSLDGIFKEVRSSYRREVLRLSKKRGKESKAITFLPHNGKTVGVFLSANTGLYGDVVVRTYRLFLKEVREKNIEATIVGKLGQSLFLQDEPDRPYTYFDFPDFGQNKDDLANLVRHLVQYETIHIYYGRYKSIVNQEPSVYDISAQSPGGELEIEKESDVKYIFEPTLEEILTFFETEMFTSLFEQAVSEGQLAKFASRMISMDKASEAIKKELGKVKRERIRFLHKELNRKLVNTYASVSLWAK